MTFLLIWLSKQFSCAAYDCGVGKTAVGIATDKPIMITMILFIREKPHKDIMVARAGAEPNPIPRRQVVAGHLADTVSFCLKPGIMEPYQRFG